MNNDAIKILVIEDDPCDFGLLEKLLLNIKQTSFIIDHRSKVQDAIACLSQKKFDLIITDLDLPDSFGIATFQKLQKTNQTLPIILLTGNIDDQIALSAVKAGAQDYLVKGNVNTDVLYRSILYAIERKSLLNEIENIRKVERFLAYHDKLTELPNRELFYDRLQQAIVQARRYNQQFAIFFLDLDGFKYVNDSAGHHIGDRLLKTAADRFKYVIRESDTVARIGGDEFTIILNRIGKKNDSYKVARKLIDAVSEPIVVNEKEFFITVSIGISLYPHDGEDADTLVQNADKAMYRAKSEGKNNYRYYNPISDRSYFENRGFVTKLKKAIENSELLAHYQPQMNLLTGGISGVEALVRWRHPDKGLLLPAEFIPLAEKKGHINQIDEWMLYAACRQSRAWEKIGIKNLRISVNLNANLFRQTHLPRLISAVIAETDICAEQLCIEITESQAMQNMDFTIAMLAKLKDLGVLIAMDDFGTGYASLNYLKRFPLDILKIDRTFVRDLKPANEDWTIISAILAMSKKMNLKVLAEGVETVVQMEALKQLDCDECQGFYFSEPVSAEDLKTRLTVKEFKNLL